MRRPDALPSDGLVAVVKRDCPTCELVAPVLADVAQRAELVVFTQDDPSFPAEPTPVDDTDLAVSVALDLDTVPTLLRFADGEEQARIVGWSRDQWETFTGLDGLGTDLPEYRPGCGSLTQDPVVLARLRASAAQQSLDSRQIVLGEAEDDIEATYARGWTDGLPVVPPTADRVARMLTGTERAPDEIVAVIPPDLVEATVEKIAVNAVLAGCLSEHLPVVLAAVEAACTDEFNMHGLIATTWFASPVVVVGGPIVDALGMNTGINALGQGNRATNTIGRALNLVVSNLGGGKPGGVDRSTLGQPGKITFCFAERAEDAPWEPLHVSRGLPEGSSGVTLFAGGGVQGIVDQLSRTPESLARSLAVCLRTVSHPKAPIIWDAMLVVSPEHGRVFSEAGWDRDRLAAELAPLLAVTPDQFLRDRDGIAEGMPDGFAEVGSLPKFRDGGLLITYTGGGAGLFSGIIGGWAGGPIGSEPVTREVRS